MPNNMKKNGNGMYPTVTSVKEVVMSKHISIIVLCLLPLFMVSCIPNYLTYSKSGIYAQCRLSGGQRLASVKTLAKSCVLNYLLIHYDEIDKQDTAFSGVNLLLGGKSINLAAVKYDDVAGITPDKPCRKWVNKNDFDKNDVFYDVIFEFYGKGGVEDHLVSVDFHFDKNKNIKSFYCLCFTEQKTGCLAFENAANKTVLEPPLKADELKALFGANVQISKAYCLK